VLRRGLILAVLAAAGLCLMACAGPRNTPSRIELPPLRLAPEALGRPLALQQQLVFELQRHRQTLDALLEVDAEAVRLAVQAMGRTGVTLHWDGMQLRQHRAEWLPQAVRGERVLDDLQFALWPAQAIRGVLPPGWTLKEEATRRQLLLDGRAWLSIERDEDASHMRLWNLLEGYRLEIHSVPLEPVTP